VPANAGQSPSRRRRSLRDRPGRACAHGQLRLGSTTAIRTMPRRILPPVSSKASPSTSPTDLATALGVRLSVVPLQGVPGMLSSLKAGDSDVFFSYNPDQNPLTNETAPDAPARLPRLHIPIMGWTTPSCSTGVPLQTVADYDRRASGARSQRATTRRLLEREPQERPADASRHAGGRMGARQSGQSGRIRRLA